ncbi:hypothetical protein [Lacipirellula limnantheis]|uniref:Uncharacterized protein n=1 Tax=Lacipirellula limnantheis TaxID=2528024 RepID=A0A517TTQ1_9BACT|nr:hypothetical protein [Lacipirellula limnantheis]QDT71755.1 hypothetical protein I41_09150 [Lacipirellula limnantheis]
MPQPEPIGVEPLPLEPAVLQDLYGLCRAIREHAHRVVQREVRKADLFAELAYGKLSDADFVRRLRSLNAAHESHLDEGVPDAGQLLQYLPPDRLRRANSQVAFGIDAAEDALAMTLKDRRQAGIWFNAFRALLGGWFLRLELLDDLASRIRSALDGTKANQPSSADTEKYLKILPRNSNVISCFHFVRAFKNCGKSQNQLIEEFAKRQDASPVALLRGMNRYGERLRDAGFSL